MSETDEFPFFRDGNWLPVRSANFHEDCATGRGIANHVIHVMRETDNPSHLGFIISGIVRGGEFSGVEIGFCSRISCLLVG